MSRWIVLCALAVAMPAQAKRVVVPMPSLSSSCSTVKSIEALGACIKTLGWKYKRVRQLERAILIEVNPPDDPLDPAPADRPQFAIYVLTSAGLRLGGLYQLSGAYELLDAKPVTINHTHGFRLEVGIATPALISIGLDPGMIGTQQTKHVVFCNGLDETCSDVVATCDWVYDGRDVSSFHGELQLVDGIVHVTGDRRFVAPQCAFATDVPLVWP